jgi:two-component system response regulator PfeR
MPESIARVLVIEDDRTIAVWFSTLFRRFGFAVAVAADGVIGLSMARARCPDVVLLDYDLPGVHGGQVLGELRREHSRERLSIVMVSGVDSLDVEGMIEAGLDAFLGKDTDGLELLSTVRTVLENRGISHRAEGRRARSET